MHTGLIVTGSAHIAFSIRLGSSTYTGSGVEALTVGQVTGLDVAVRVGSGSPTRLLVVNDIGYARLPTPTRPGKPWAVVTATAHNAAIRALAKLRQVLEDVVSPRAVQALTAAGGSFRSSGKATVNGAPALVYRLRPHVAGIPVKDPLRRALTTVGVANPPMHLWVDGRGRPLQVVVRLAVSGQSTTLQFASFNEKLSLALPATGQVDASP